MFSIKNGQNYSLDDVRKHQQNGGSVLRSAHVGNFDIVTLFLAQENFPIILHEHIKGTAKIYEPSFVKIGNSKIPIAKDIELPLICLSLSDNQDDIRKIKKLVGDFKNPAQAQYLSLKKLFPNNVKLASRIFFGQDPFFYEALNILANNFPHLFANYVRSDGTIFNLSQKQDTINQIYISASGEEITIEKNKLAKLTYNYLLKTVDVVEGKPMHLEGVVMKSNLYILLSSICEIYKDRNGEERFKEDEVTVMHFSGTEMINYLILNEKQAECNSQEINKMYDLLFEKMHGFLPQKINFILIPTWILKNFITDSKKNNKKATKLVSDYEKLKTTSLHKKITERLKQSIYQNLSYLKNISLAITQYDIIQNKNLLFIPDLIRSKKQKEIRFIWNELVRESLKMDKPKDKKVILIQERPTLKLIQGLAKRLYKMTKTVFYTILKNMEKYHGRTENKQETGYVSSLERAKIEIPKENPDLPMQLKFEVSSSDTIEKLLAVKDLTLPTESGQERNIIGKVYDQVISKLNEHNFPDIHVIRGGSVVEAKDNFDSLLFSPGNPGRSSTYTRYTDEDHILRTHTSALIPATFKKLEKDINRSTFVLPGLVYRRDVIDPRHLDVFHQIDVWTLQENKTYGKVNRENLLELAKTVFEATCPDAKMIVYEAKHPYTVNGIEVYAGADDKEIEVLEAGLIHPDVLRNSGIDPEQYSGLALGMGVERLIMARKNLPDIRLIRSIDPRVIKQMTSMEKFKNVSDQPAIARDMSYCVSKNDTEEDICEAIRNVFGDKSDLLEEVKILERTSFDKLNPIAVQRLGAKEDQDNVLVRIILRHPDKTLTKKESAELYSMAYPKLHQGVTKGYEVK